MSTGSEIATQALREGNLISLNDALTDLQSTEALLLLNRFVESLLGFELGDFAMDWPVPPSTTAPVPARYPILPQVTKLPDNVFPYPPGNVRIILNLTAAQTIYMPQDPDDGARILFINIGDGAQSLTVDGNGRLVKGTATITETATALNEQLWFFRSDLASWNLVILPMLAATSSPFPSLYDDLLAIGVFIRLAPRYGRTVSAETASTYKRMLQRLTTQYRQHVPTPSADPQGFSYPASDSLRFASSSRSLFE